MERIIKTKDEKKAEFRESEEWKNFRLELLENQSTDPISNLPLTIDANCHHLDQTDDLERYFDLNPEKFVMLNRESHQLVHLILPMYLKDPNCINNIVAICEKMKSYITPTEDRKAVESESPIEYKEEKPIVTKAEAKVYLRALSALYNNSITDMSNGRSYQDFIDFGLSEDLLNRLAQNYFIGFNKGKNYAAFIPWHANRMHPGMTIDNLRNWANA